MLFVNRCYYDSSFLLSCFCVCSSIHESDWNGTTIQSAHCSYLNILILKFLFWSSNHYLSETVNWYVPYSPPPSFLPLPSLRILSGGTRQGAGQGGSWGMVQLDWGAVQCHRELCYRPPIALTWSVNKGFTLTKEGTPFGQICQQLDIFYDSDSVLNSNLLN